MHIQNNVQYRLYYMFIHAFVFLFFFSFFSLLRPPEITKLTLDAPFLWKRAHFRLGHFRQDVNSAWKGFRGFPS